jgi:hypothetical protein
VAGVDLFREKRYYLVCSERIVLLAGDKPDEQSKIFSTQIENAAAISSGEILAPKQPSITLL